jgi:hypothetical protein
MTVFIVMEGSSDLQARNGLGVQAAFDLGSRATSRSRGAWWIAWCGWVGPRARPVRRGNIPIFPILFWRRCVRPTVHPRAVVIARLELH